MATPNLTIRGAPVDLVYVLVLVALYAATHWLIAAVARLGSLE